MATTFRHAVLDGSMAASRLHRALRSKDKVDEVGGNVDVFGAIQSLGIPLVMRPLDGILGAYLDVPIPGILITTNRRMAVQRFTAAHELGHATAEHSPSLDDKKFLPRAFTQHAETASPVGHLQETEADAFAIEFLIPRWLIKWHAAQQGWRSSDLKQPEVVYQLSLRLGASYNATCWSLSRYDWCTTSEARRLAGIKPRSLKAALLGNYAPDNYRGDVWRLTERDAGLKIEGSRDDHFVLELQEHSGGGYIWNIEQLKESGFAVVSDAHRNLDDDGIGNHTLRSVVAHPVSPLKVATTIEECRPWSPASPLSTFAVDFDLSGPEVPGLSRAARQAALEAA